MSLKNKILVAVLSVFFILFMTISQVLAGLNVNKPEEKVLPASGLSDSIFESQNTSYVENPDLPQKLKFKTIPYTIDVPSVAGAVVDEGNIYKVSDSIYLYITEFNPLEKYLQNAVTAELGKALLMNYNNELTQMSSAAEEDGFINGYGAVYKILDMTVTDSTQLVPSTTIGYEISVPEYDNKIFVSVVSQTAIAETDNQTMANMKVLLDQLVMTLQYSEEVKAEIDGKAAEAEAAAEAAASEAAAELEYAGQSGSDIYDELTGGNTSESKEMKDMSLTIDKDYEDLVLHFYWENTTTAPDALTIYNLNKTVSYEPTSIENGEATFRMGRINKGSMIIEITGTNYGQCSMALYEEKDDPANKIENTSDDYSQHQPTYYNPNTGDSNGGSGSYGSDTSDSSSSSGSVTVNSDGTITYDSSAGGYTGTNKNMSTGEVEY